MAENDEYQISFFVPLILMELEPNRGFWASARRKIRNSTKTSAYGVDIKI